MSSGPFRLANAEWLAHRHVEGHDRIRFIAVPRARHAQVPFLTDACLGEGLATHEMDVAECLAQAQPGHLSFLFHSAFCGSTLLSRALDWPGAAMGLSEPVILNDVVGFHRRGADRRAVARLADAATRLLARPFAPGEGVVVKPSNLINPLAELLLALRPEAKAVFLYAPLESFLLSVARKGLPCRLWCRELAEVYCELGYLAPLGIDRESLFRQSDLQVAATGWLAQRFHFTALARKLGPGRLRTLDAERMNAAPAAAVGETGRFFELALDDAAVARIVAGPAFTRHSKSGGAYSVEARAEDYAAARLAYGEEIGIVLTWAEKLAASAGIAFDAPDPLLAAT